MDEKDDGTGSKSRNLQIEIEPEYVQEDKVVDLVLKRGQIAFHDIYLVHGSEPNNSDHSRRAMTLRFMPTSSYYDRDLGRDKFNNLGVPLERGERKIYAVTPDVEDKCDGSNELTYQDWGGRHRR